MNYSLASKSCCAAVLLVLAACESKDFLGGDLAAGLDLLDPAKGIVDAHGNVISAVDIGDPVVVQIPGLSGSTVYTVTVTDPNGAEYNPAGGLKLITDEEGTIHRATVVQNLDSGANNAPVVAPPGEYTISVQDSGGVEQDSVDFDVEDRSRVYCSDGAGTRRASFPPGQVFATVEAGGGSLADGDYNVHVGSDLGIAMIDGGGLPPMAGTVTVTGGTGTADLGNYTDGAYDVIVDVDGDGLYDQDQDLISRHHRRHACFSIQVANTGAAITAQLASDRNGNQRDVFDPARPEALPVSDIYAAGTAGEASAVTETLGIDKYVVPHQDTWNDGDPLTDATGAVEIDPVQEHSLSEAAWLVWPRQQLEAGCYDIVLDMNQNGQFDLGVDVVDNMDEDGNPTCGVRVADASCTAVDITSHDPVFATLDTAIALAGSLTGTATRGLITITSGVQSNTVALAPAADFSANIPLFSGGINYITVAFDMDTGETCAETLVVTQGLLGARFRVQLTWDGSTDMDLHVVRPGGAYANGGGGDDDCNYANCNVGLDGQGTNSIDWGNPGEDDDPKLDVDCIACGNGIENIWMTEISENGDYTVFVDAFSGTETDVTASIFIDNALVGQVNCGDMASSTATDSCRVGVIRWSGSSGAFIADGTKAGDF